MPSYGMLRFVALARTDLSEECIASIIKVKRIVELGKSLAVTNNRSTPRRNTLLFKFYKLSKDIQMLNPNVM
jgi:hypothetical protein